MSVSIAVVCESPVDRRTGCDLADRIIRGAGDWIDEMDEIDVLRQYRGFRVSDEHLKWTEVPDLASELHVRAHGWFSGEPGAPDALATRRALLVLRISPESPDAVILLRDADHQLVREKGLNQGREELNTTWHIPIVIGVQKTMRECWVIAGFERKTTKSRRCSTRCGTDSSLDSIPFCIPSVSPPGVRQRRRTQSVCSGC